MDRVPQEVPVVMIAGFTACGCVMFASPLPATGSGIQWMSELIYQSRQGLELRLIQAGSVPLDRFYKCRHGWAEKPKPKYVVYDASLIAARDGVIAAVEVMRRLRGTP